MLRKSHIQSLIVLAALLSALHAARAQQGPSENDLFAGYCTGALRAEIPVYRSRWLSGDVSLADWLKKAMSDGLVSMEARLSTTSRYLAARGYGTSISGEAISLAISSGENDFARCDEWRFLHNPRIYAECKSAHGDSRSQIEQCVETQQAVACKQIAKCSDVSRLPM